MKVVDETGNRYGSLVVIARAESTARGGARWLCRCDCGREAVVLGVLLRQGSTRSCGCSKTEGKVVDRTGQTFGRLTVIRRAEERKAGRRGVVWECQCACGAVVNVAAERLGVRTRSCGCLHREMAGDRTRTHGDSKSAEHRTWSGMITRCENPNREKFRDYGGRGIRVCERWRGANGYQNFLADMGRRPSPRHSIDRIDVDGNYEPGNCRWATPSEQARNTRKAKARRNAA